MIPSYCFFVCFCFVSQIKIKILLKKASERPLPLTLQASSQHNITLVFFLPLENICYLSPINFSAFSLSLGGPCNLSIKNICCPFSCCLNSSRPMGQCIPYSAVVLRILLISQLSSARELIAFSWG